ncbi:MAG: hypothetical protein Q4C25_01265 [Bacillota bacterium]|nr:hypothetical protein [Bacillota bacterium]
MNQPSFIIRFLIFFVPLLLFLFVMILAGITDNIFMTIILCLAFVWLEQAVYKAILKKKETQKK